MIQTVADAPYRGVQHALRHAYGSEVWDLYQRPSYLRAIRPDGNKRADEMTAADWCAQAAIVLSKVRDLPEHLAWTVQAAYTLDDPGRTRGRKLEAIIMVGRHVRLHEPEFMGYRDREHKAFLRDGIRRWCGMEGARPDAVWADRLGVSDRTIQSTRLGNRRFRRRGLYHVLDGYIDDAVARLRVAFREGGIIR